MTLIYSLLPVKAGSDVGFCKRFSRKIEKSTKKQPEMKFLKRGKKRNAEMAAGVSKVVPNACCHTHVSSRSYVRPFTSGRQYANHCQCLIPRLCSHDWGADGLWVIMESPWTVGNYSQECSQLSVVRETTGWHGNSEGVNYFLPLRQRRNPLFKEKKHLWVEAPPPPLTAPPPLALHPLFLLPCSSWLWGAAPVHLHHSPENGAELDWTLDHWPLLCIMYSVYLNTLKCWNCTCCTHCALCLNCDYCAHCAVTVLCLARYHQYFKY